MPRALFLFRHMKIKNTTNEQGGREEKTETMYIDHKRCTEYNLHGHMKKNNRSQNTSFSLNKNNNDLPFNRFVFTSPKIKTK